jgi:hypothetical protein
VLSLGWPFYPGLSVLKIIIIAIQIYLVTSTVPLILPSTYLPWDIYMIQVPSLVATVN